VVGDEVPTGSVEDAAHSESKEAAALATGVRDALDETVTPRAQPPSPSTELGRSDGGIYKFSFARSEPVAMDGRVLAPAMGTTTAINFQPTGGGKAAINGDFAMTREEIQPVVQALRAGGIEVVALHNHTLGEQPRLFYMHFWANDDAARLAQALGTAVRTQAVEPVADRMGQGGPR
jgi:hypothetical protein